MGREGDLKMHSSPRIYPRMKVTRHTAAPHTWNHRQARHASACGAETHRGGGIWGNTVNYNWQIAGGSVQTSVRVKHAEEIQLGAPVS